MHNKEITSIEYQIMNIPLEYQKVAIFNPYDGELNGY
ncbi:hypothetical protein BTTOUR_33155 [Bacillus thuringiensis serovar toumanoffi]|uniref:GNAT family N-acetyltransferase n=1 Tax=Bacillus thuringiensis serovar toumanoffi TaxID=180862 RepID=A0ABD5I928_BACTU|nr:hypothetical protein [Bacillus thuringiensis serovar toumanoffi]